MFPRLLRPFRPRFPHHAPLPRHARPRALVAAVHGALASLVVAMALPPTLVHAGEPLVGAAPQHYAIPAGPLGHVLAQFAATAGVPLSFDPTPLGAVQSAGLQGRFTVRDGFARLLDGTDYELVDKGDGAYSLRKRAAAALPAAGSTALPTVTVNASAERLPGELPAAYAGGQVARGGRVGLLGNADVMDTPFSTISYTSDLMNDQQSVTLADVLNKDSSVRFTGQIGGVTDSFYIRGFPIGEGNLSEVAFDGVYGIAPNYHVFTEYAERVEVVKGPAALLYGMSPNGGLGGVINIVPKRALPQDLTRFTIDHAGSSQVGEHIDFSRRFGKGREWGIRFNGLHREGKTPLDNQSSRTDIGFLAIDYQGERFRASLDLLSQDEKVDAPTRPYLLASGLQTLPAPDGRRNISQGWGWWKSQGESALLHAEYDLNDKVTFFADAGGSAVRVGRLSDQTPTVLNANGLTSSTPGHYKFKVDRSTYDVGMRARLQTGPLKHALAVQISNYEDEVGQANNPGKAMLTNLHSPVAYPMQHIAPPLRVPKLSASRLSGMAVADTMSAFDDRLQFTFGLRHQKIVSDNFNATTGAVTTAYDKSAVTPLAGLVVKPWQHVSIYANYIEGLSKGDVAPVTASNAGEIFSPYKSKQYEVGVKFDFERVMATVAAFQITKPSGQISSGNLYASDGEQRNRGLEMNISGEAAKGVRLLGGLTLLDSKLTRTNNRATVGNRPVGVPNVMANLGAEWDLPWVPGLTLNGSMIYTGKEYVNQANTQSVPSWTTVDLGARYTTKVYGRSTTFRGTLVNAFNRKYWSGVASYGTISQGIPRTLMLSASVDF
ncbi:iron complex outermembrane receptor protein [Variovorax sp. 54]|uniref:TonB-dependent receptor n=1 Tax=Variovorax sp. 54 TaxID=2035212 RepID=UPI000C39581E|nr:TonB-dependent receptor [Variovorax sp. 54]PIF77713.1 iron complex outermembrane receptor protein [Variovorax sp. 54]